MSVQSLFVSSLADGRALSTEDDLRSYLEQRARDVGNEFWLSDEPDGSPALVLVVNGGSATVMSVGADGVMDGIALGDGPTADPDAMVRFELPLGAEPVDFLADTVVPWGRAVECAIEFLVRRTRPTCVRWREL